MTLYTTFLTPYVGQLSGLKTFNPFFYQDFNRVSRDLTPCFLLLSIRPIGEIFMSNQALIQVRFSKSIIRVQIFINKATFDKNFFFDVLILIWSFSRYLHHQQYSDLGFLFLVNFEKSFQRNDPTRKFWCFVNFEKSDSN